MSKHTRMRRAIKPKPKRLYTTYQGYRWQWRIPAEEPLNILDLMIHPDRKIPYG